MSFDKQRLQRRKRVSEASETELRKASIVLYALLFLWFTLDLIGVPGLVTQDDWRSPSGLLELVLLVLLMGRLQKWKAEPFLTLATLSLWGYLQYIAHWHGFFFGASGDRLTRYYSLFSGMYRFFPESRARIVPDAYHTVLGLLIATNLLAVAYQVVSLFRHPGSRTAQRQD